MKSILGVAYEIAIQSSFIFFDLVQQNSANVNFTKNWPELRFSFNGYKFIAYKRIPTENTVRNAVKV